jgi:hypothetical protein
LSIRLRLDTLFCHDGIFNIKSFIKNNWVVFLYYT